MRLLALVIIAATTATLSADILHLRDGSRHRGQLLSQDSRTVVFRVESADLAEQEAQRLAQDADAHAPSADTAAEAAHPPGRR